MISLLSFSVGKKAVICLLLLGVLPYHPVQSSYITPPKQKPADYFPIFNDIVSQVKTAAVTATILGSFTFLGPLTVVPNTANALVSPSVEEALIEASDATYPILKTLKPEYIEPLSGSIVKLLVNKVPSDKFVNFLDKGADVIMSIPENDLAAFTSSIKDAYSDLSPETCDLVPLPVDAANKFATSEGLAKVDPNKLKAVNEKLDATIKAISKQTRKNDDDVTSTTITAICLPTEKNLEKLFIGQTELSLTLKKEALQEFGKAGTAVGKSIPPGDLFRLLPDFQKVERGVDVKAKKTI